MNGHSEAKLGAIYPELARRIRSADGMMTSLGFRLEISQGLRTFAEQRALYLKGRDLAGNIIDPTKIVTHAKAGESYHNYGLAVDFFFENLEGAAIWAPDFPGYAKMVEIAESLGLVCGVRWPEPKTDPDHIQLTGEFPMNEPDANLKYILKEGGLLAVYAEMNKALGIEG